MKPGPVTADEGAGAGEGWPPLRRRIEPSRPGRSELRTGTGREVMLALEAPPGLSSEQSIHALVDGYQAELREAGLDRQSELFVRFYLQNEAEQAPLVHRLMEANQGGLVSTVAQAPVSGSGAALHAYHLQGSSPAKKKWLAPRALLVEHGGYRSLWSSQRASSAGNTGEQTSELLRAVEARIGEQGGTLRDDLLRTWFFVGDIDGNYAGLVRARRELFLERGLGPDTHFVASTGIGMDAGNSSTPLLLDALAQLGLAPEQVTFLDAPDHLCPAHAYGVTFERATRVTYGDRTHLHVSGTASIDAGGNVLFEGDPARQTERTLVNVGALLRAGGAEFEDLRQVAVYLRLPGDAEKVAAVLQEALPPRVPLLMVRGAVCRPQWLVEIEGMAMLQRGDPRFAPYA